jgi:hypothetical protein
MRQARTSKQLRRSDQARAQGELQREQHLQAELLVPQALGVMQAPLWHLRDPDRMTGRG